MKRPRFVQFVPPAPAAGAVRLVVSGDVGGAATSFDLEALADADTVSIRATSTGCGGLDWLICGACAGTHQGPRGCVLCGGYGVVGVLQELA